MQLTSQEEYGLRCLLQVARSDEGKPVRLQAIAEAEGLSVDYVAKLMRILRRAKLVVSTRGAAGGYRLSCAPADLGVWEALQVLGTPLYSDDFCVAHKGKLSHCIHSTDCSIRALWRRVEGAIEGVLGQVTLADLLHPERAMTGLLDVRVLRPNASLGCGGVV